MRIIFIKFNRIIYESLKLISILDLLLKFSVMRKKGRCMINME